MEVGDTLEEVIRYCLDHDGPEGMGFVEWMAFEIRKLDAISL